MIVNTTSTLFAIVAVAVALPAALISAARAWQLLRQSKSSSRVQLKITRDSGEVIELHAESLREEDLARILKYLNEEIGNLEPPRGSADDPKD